MLHIQMKRIYNPVGQGAFCAESFQVGETAYYVVFDCGSGTQMNLRDGTSEFVNREIEENFRSVEEIEAVFISHFDREHMNGLEKLLQEYRVKKLFLPMLDDGCRLLMSLKARIEFGNKSGKFVRMLIDNPMELLQDENYHIGQIVFVDEADEVSVDADGKILDMDDFDGMGNHFASGSLLQCMFGMGQPVWKYVPVNFREDDKIRKMREMLQRENLPVPKNDSDVSDLWEKHRREVIAVLGNDALEDFSTNSLIVYSGKASEEMDVEMHPDRTGHSWGTCRSFFKVRSGCVYMGDYDAGSKAGWNRIKNAYREEWDEISVWLLPHHGSPKNFNREMASHGAEIYIACAGTNNPYHYPGRSVTNKLQLTGKIVYWVNEIDANKVIFLYELSFEQD